MKQLSQDVLSDMIKTRRKEKKITQEQLCDLTGINRSMIGRIERKDYIPSISQLEKLAEILDFEIEELFVNTDKPTVFTAFRGANLTPQEQEGVKHLTTMMLAAKQQIMLHRALYRDMEETHCE